MKIWLVTVGEPLPIDKDKERLYRTGLLASFLSNRKHQVVWWTSNFNHAKKEKRESSGQKTVTINENLSINLLEGIEYRSNVSLKRIINHINTAFDFKNKSREYEKPDIIICSYPTVELSYQATKFALKHSIPIIIDVRDLWPESIVNLFPTFAKPFIKAALWWSFYQSNYIFRHATSIVAVSPKYLNYGLIKAGRGGKINNSKIVDGVFPIGYQKNMVSNYTMAESQHILNDLAINSSKFVCWFVGYFGKTYDLTPIIEAAKILQQKGIDNIQFVFSGTGDRYSYWVEKSKEYGNILFTGWVDKRQLEVIGSTAKVGLQAYADKAPQGLANKLFEYLSFGLPVLSSLRGENEELIADYEVGFTYDITKPQSFLEKLMILYEDSTLWERMSNRAKQVFVEHFDNDRINHSIEEHMLEVVKQYE